MLVREGIYQRAEQLGVQLVPVEVDMWPLRADRQMEIVEEMLAMELHGLVAQSMPPSLARLIANSGVPIVLMVEVEGATSPDRRAKSTRCSSSHRT